MSVIGRLGDVIRAPFRVAATQNTVSNLEHRLETVRSELLYELRYGRRGEAKVEAVEKLILAPEKLQDTIRLNLGCGHVPLAGFVNVDMRELPGVDIIAPIDDIPIKQGTVAEIFSSHLLEHFPQEELRRNLLPYWGALLAPGGIFRAVVPDGEAMLTKAAEGSYPFHDFREVLFGSQDYTGDFHYNMFTPDSLSDLLREAGFSEITVPARGRQNGRCYEFEIQAIRTTPQNRSLAH
jgi:predicted SAM-dependent methyltransferase